MPTSRLPGRLMVQMQGRASTPEKKRKNWSALSNVTLVTHRESAEIGRGEEREWVLIAPCPSSSPLRRVILLDATQALADPPRRRIKDSRKKHSVLQMQACTEASFGFGWCSWGMSGCPITTRYLVWLVPRRFTAALMDKMQRRISPRG